MQIAGWLLIILGTPFALCNWYSPFSEAVSGKHSSMVPPLGGLLIAVGAFLLTGSIWWALIAIPADPGILMLLLLIPTIAYDAYAHSSINLVAELHAWRNGHRTIVKLYKNSTATISHSDGSALYGLGAKWSQNKDGYVLTDYIEGRRCQLRATEDGLLAAESLDNNDEHDAVDLHELYFHAPERSEQVGTRDDELMSEDDSVD